MKTTSGKEDKLRNDDIINAALNEDFNPSNLVFCIFLFLPDLSSYMLVSTLKIKIVLLRSTNIVLFLLLLHTVPGFVVLCLVVRSNNVPAPLGIYFKLENFNSSDFSRSQQF